ncbi:MAG: hypothetical protein DRP87_14730 [Spirochaetes bacterium]|nr:MAG: hypothetical protein DRP87_14730 [Spirochaetota bacterium]
MVQIIMNAGVNPDLQYNLQEPELPAREDWGKMYWKTWELLVENMGHGSNRNSFSEDYLDAAFNGNIFQLGTCLIVQFASYGFKILPILQSLDNFYQKQEPDGYICR